MATLYRYEEFRRRRRATFFTRQELNGLLALYSRRVMSGEWRDYAIDQRSEMAIFSIFRHSLDSPAFRIAKRPPLAGRPAEYLVFCGRERVKRAKNIDEALAVFERRLSVVS